MAAVPVNILIDQGANFDTSFYITNQDGTPLNMAGYTGEAALKKSFTAPDGDKIPFSLSFLDRTLGHIQIALSSTETNALTKRRYVYDILLNSPNDYKTRVIEGLVEINLGVS
jgi:hypothetical protein